MLVLSRKENEGIVIGDGITVRVMAIEDGRVRLGIDAPSEVSINREEVFEAIRNENRKAASASAEALGALNAMK